MPHLEYYLYYLLLFKLTVQFEWVPTAREGRRLFKKTLVIIRESLILI